MALNTHIKIQILKITPFSTILEKDKPAIVFTDLNMPVMTGIELTSKLRERFDLNELPIIMVTTQSEGADHEAAFKAGVNKVINKPFSADQLADAMQLVGFEARTD